jgi:hypothetical protein
MTRTRLVAASLAAAAALLSTPAAHADPLFHSCEGQVDYACTDPSGALCTVWLGFRCEIGT